MNDLMTLEDIAQMHHCSMRHARDVLVKIPGFPDDAPTMSFRYLVTEAISRASRGAK